MSTKSIVILVAMALLAGTGCGKQNEKPLGESRPMPKTVDEGGWPLYEQPADGFALALPPSWNALKLGPTTLDQTLANAIRANPELKAMEQSLRQQVAAGVKFLGTEKASGGPNVSVFRLPLQGDGSLDAAAADMEKQYESTPGMELPVRRQRARLQPGEAERFDLVVKFNLPSGGEIRLGMISYLMVRGGEVFVVTCTAQVDETPTYASTFDRITQSFRFLGK